MYQKGQTQVLILAGIVLAVALTGGIFFLGRVTLPRQDSSGQAASESQAPVATPQPTPSPDETRNWKTYTNKRYKFLIKYPSSLEPSENNWGVYLEDVPALEREEYPVRVSILVNINNNNRFINFEKFYNQPVGQEFTDENNPKHKIIKTKNFKVDGYNAVEYLLETPPIPETEAVRSCTRTVVIQRVDDLIKLDDFLTSRLGSCYIFINKSFNTTFNQILSTFKFIPQ